MDLGLGDSNQKVGNIAASAILQSAKAQENAINETIQDYDSLLNDDSALASWRLQRVAQLQQQQRLQQEWKALGHGVYMELSPSTQTSDVAKLFFEATKQSPKVVVHFYRPSTRQCDIFHKHLGALAPKHLETRFLKINVEGCELGANGAAYLVEKLGIVVMPTLAIIVNRNVAHLLQGFDEVNGVDCTTSAVEYVLGQYGALECEMEMPSELDDSRGVSAIRIQRTQRRTTEDSDEDY